MHFIEKLFDLQAGDFSKVLFSFLTNIVLAIVIAVVGFWLTGVLTRLVNRVLRKSDTDPGLVSFLTSFLSMALKIMVVISAITQLGVEMTSFLTLLGAAGIAIGMAFSGTLSNFAGGIMILVLKPFRVGDDIKALGEQGVVYEVQIFNTYLRTADNKTLIFPNGPLANGTIINYTKEKTRRIEWSFTLEQNVNVKEVQTMISSVLSADKRIQTKPEPLIGVQQMTEAGLEIRVRCWVKTPDYSLVFHQGQQAVVEAMLSAGIPFAKS
ncbi:MAG: mechanosensitive ion channel family protein [Flavobacteriales bacterium]